jgi:hypothetical protein
VFLGYLVTSYRRFRGLEGQITQLARRLALDEVASELHPAQPDATPHDDDLRPEQSRTVDLGRPPGPTE